MDRRTYYRRKKRKYRRKRIQKLFIAGIFLFGSIVLVKNTFYDSWLREISVETASLIGRKHGIKNQDTLEKLREMAKTDERVEMILNHADRYPEDLLDMLAGNAEAAEFVLQYPEKKDREPATTTEGVVKGEIPLFLQWDERWGYAEYGDTFLAVSGCGPTSLAMVAAGLTGNDSITPYAVARYAQDNGYYAGESGTSWLLMTEGGRAFGVAGEEIGADEASVLSALESGCPIICSMRPGDFTTTGHFIVLTGMEDGKIKIHDSNSERRSDRAWEYDEIKYQINNLWAFTAL